MTPIFQALGLGYNATQIMSFLSRAFPNVGRQINKASKAGYSANQILDFLGKSMQPTPFTEEDTESSIRGRQRKRREEIERSLLKTAAAAGVAYGVGRALPGIAQGIRGAFGRGSPPPQGGLPPVQATPSPQPPIGPQPMAGAPVQPQPIPPVGPSPAQATAPTPVPPQAAQAPTPSPVPTTPWAHLTPQQSVSIIKEMGLEGRIDNLISAGNKPEVVAAALNAGLTPGQRKWFGDKLKAGETKPLQELVQDYLATGKQSLQVPNAQKEVSPQQVRPMLEPSGQKLDETAKATQGKIQKGDLVFDEQSGISGEIKDMKQKEALVSDNGKVHKVKLDELEKPPEDLIETVQNLLQIPEVDRSAVISLVTYRPSTKQMFVQYHNGETYVYEDIPQERVDEIANAMGVPVTSGKNIYGAWEQGKQDSRGAALIHGILRDPRYSKENEGKTWEKIGTFYDYWKGLRKKPKRKRK